MPPKFVNTSHWGKLMIQLVVCWTITAKYNFENCQANTSPPMKRNSANVLDLGRYFEQGGLSGFL